MYPGNLPFSHHAAYQVWRTLNMKEWKLDDDPLISAQKLLANAANIQTIHIDVNDDYECLAFSVPEVLEVWSHRVKELVMDLACEYQLASNIVYFNLCDIFYVQGNALQVIGSYLSCLERQGAQG